MSNYFDEDEDNYKRSDSNPFDAALGVFLIAFTIFLIGIFSFWFLQTTGFDLFVIIPWVVFIALIVYVIILIIKYC